MMVTETIAAGHCSSKNLRNLELGYIRGNILFFFLFSREENTKAIKWDDQGCFSKALADKIMLIPYVILSSLGFMSGIFSVGSQ